MTHDRTAERLGLPIVRFLLDRIDDDENELDRLARRESRGREPGVVGRGVRSVEQLRANLIAKRHVIGDLQQLLVLRDLPAETSVRVAALSALHSMCLPHRGHRRYDAEWAAGVLDAGGQTSAGQRLLA